MEVGGWQLQFLDLLISIENNRIETTVYSKPTDAHLYLNANSAHPKKQSQLVDKLKQNKEPLVMAGDGRHDSMGHRAKYCAYTIFCCTSPCILHFNIVQV